MWVDEEDGFEEDDELSERQRSRLHMQATTVLQLYKLWNEREQAQLASLEHQPGSTHEEKGQGVQEVGGDDGTAREVFQNIQVFAEEAGKMLVPPIHGRTVQDYHSEWVANAERSESGDGSFNMDRRGKAECVWILDEEDKKRQFTAWMSENAKTPDQALRHRGVRERRSAEGHPREDTHRHLPSVAPHLSTSSSKVKNRKRPKSMKR